MKKAILAVIAVLLLSAVSVQAGNIYVDDRGRQMQVQSTKVERGTKYDFIDIIVKASHKGAVQCVVYDSRGTAVATGLAPIHTQITEVTVDITGLVADRVGCSYY